MPMHRDFVQRLYANRETHPETFRSTKNKFEKEMALVFNEILF